MSGPKSHTWQAHGELLDGLAMPAVAVDFEGRITYANAAAAALLGSSVEDLLREHAGERLIEASERAAVGEVLRLVRTTGSWTGDLAIATPTGATQLATSWTVVRAGDAPIGALVLVEGAEQSWVPESSSAEQGHTQPSGRRLRRLAAVTSELLAADTVERVSEVVTDHMMNAAGATVASLSLLVDENTLALIGIRGGREGVASRWATYALDSNTPAAECLRTREVLYVEDQDFARRYPGLEAGGPGSRSVLCLPLLAGTRCLGVVTLSFPRRREIDTAEQAFYRLLADTCAMTIDRLQAQEAAADREAKLTFLADASAKLSSDLDYESTLVAVAQMAVPWFADWCAIALEDDGRLRTLSVAHADPEMVAFVEELQTRYPPKPDPTVGSYKVLATGQSELLPDVPDELLEQVAQDEEHLRLLRLLKLRSGMLCPLKVHEKVLGVITWVSGEGGRRFTVDDLAFGESLAQRAAIAIDNAQLHSQVRDVALQLQRAVLPESLPKPDGWSTAVRYLPAGRTDAGGDFYDVVPLRDGRLAAFVGDVMGRGVKAASVMAQMRSAIRTLVSVDPSPAAVMSGMDRVFETLHLEQLVSMAYALADPSLDHLAVINAGHPEPILIRADGSVEPLTHTDTLILGAGGGHRSVLTTEMQAGDALFLYTDGLVERRGSDNEAGLTRLLASRPRPDGDLTEWLRLIVEEVRDPSREDDVAALVLARADGR